MDFVDLAHVRRRLHRELLASVDLVALDRMPREHIATAFRAALCEMVEAEPIPLDRRERERLVEEILDNILGLGPLEPVLRDQGVTEIHVEAFDRVRVLRGDAETTDEVRFDDAVQLAAIVERILDAHRGDAHFETGREHTYRGKLLDGSAFEASLPPRIQGSPSIVIMRHIPEVGPGPARGGG